MKSDWDYTALANAYLKRPEYASEAIDEMLSRAGISAGACVCDMGAGVAHLTLMLAYRGLEVVAVEPNDAMRHNGEQRTLHVPGIVWYEGTAEESGQPSSSFDLVTFGSSFNVTDRQRSLQETARILKAGGWFACMWNHRDLTDPIQTSIEQVISDHLPNYDYGSRRQDQTMIIEASGLFGPVQRIEGRVMHRQTREDCVEAWRSHATLERQAKNRFSQIVDAIEEMLVDKGHDEFDVPYTTRIWLAPVRKEAAVGTRSIS